MMPAGFYSVIQDSLDFELGSHRRRQLDSVYYRVGDSTTRFAIAYMRLYADKKANRVIEKSEWKSVFATCMTCAHKFVSDDRWTMQMYAYILDIDLNHLLRYEINLLILLEFKMYLSMDDVESIFSRVTRISMPVHVKRSPKQVSPIGNMILHCGDSQFGRLSRSLTASSSTVAVLSQDTPGAHPDAGCDTSPLLPDPHQAAEVRAHPDPA